MKTKSIYLLITLMMLFTIIPLKAGIVHQLDAYDVATKFLN